MTEHMHPAVALLASVLTVWLVLGVAGQGRMRLSNYEPPKDLMMIGVGILTLLVMGVFLVYRMLAFNV